MPRIDVRYIDQETLNLLDEQCKKYGISSRSDYLRLLIKMDILTNIVGMIKKTSEK
jgi:metal-responsive CopG/Arc/MetJ family transcriptional regulator